MVPVGWGGQIQRFSDKIQNLYPYQQQKSKNFLIKYQNCRNPASLKNRGHGPLPPGHGAPALTFLQKTYIGGGC